MDDTGPSPKDGPGFLKFPRPIWPCVSDISQHWDLIFSFHALGLLAIRGVTHRNVHTDFLLHHVMTIVSCCPVINWYLLQLHTGNLMMSWAAWLCIMYRQGLILFAWVDDRHFLVISFPRARCSSHLKSWITEIWLILNLVSNNRIKFRFNFYFQPMWNYCVLRKARIQIFFRLQFELYG